MKKLFDEIPYLTDGEIELRQLKECDFSGLSELTGDSGVYKMEPSFLVERQYPDPYELLGYIYGECFENKESLILAVCRVKDNSFCGLAEFYGFKDSIHKACIGIRLVRSAWGQGISTRGAKLMVDYLLNGTDTEIVTASSMTGNFASARVLTKVGFTKTAEGVDEDWGFDEPVKADKWFI